MMKKFKYNKEGKLTRVVEKTGVTATALQVRLLLSNLDLAKNIKKVGGDAQIYWDYSPVFDADNIGLIAVSDMVGMDVNAILTEASIL